MQTPDASGNRVPFHIQFVTADRAAWGRKKELLQQLKSIPEDDARYAPLKNQIDAIHVGGKVIEHDDCVISRARGVHAKKLAEDSREAIKNPNNNQNRTRNIIFRPGDNIRKMHISLFFKFNHQEVIY